MTSQRSYRDTGGAISMNAELDEIASYLDSIEGGASRVGIQVPDGLKRAAVELARAVEERLGVEVVLSANPCFGACDLDETLLDFTDVLFHIGHTPLLQRDGVVYVEHRIDLPWRAAVEAAVPMLSGMVGLLTNAQHLHLIREIREFLEGRGLQTIVGEGDAGVSAGQVLGCNLSAVPRQSDTLLYVGSGSFHPLGIALSTGRPVVQADIEMNRAERVDAKELKKRRYLAMARAMDAKSWGVIVGEKPGQRFLPVSLDMKRRLPGAVILALDQIVPPALDGLPFDAYVVCACPRVALDEASLYPKPMLTPGEALVVAGERKMEDVDFFWGLQAGKANEK